MKIFYDIINSSNSKTAIAIGCFDGIHKGHQEVIKKILIKKAQGMLPTVFTFSQNPKFMSGSENKRLISVNQKHSILADMGVEIIYSIDFFIIKDLSAHEFVKEVLVDKLKAGYISCGFNFRFGNKKEGNAQDLKNICKIYNIDVDITRPVTYKKIPISSTRIREELNAGNIEIVSKLLGRPFNIKSVIVKKDDFNNKTIDSLNKDKCISENLLPTSGMYISSSFINKNRC